MTHGKLPLPRSTVQFHQLDTDPVLRRGETVSLVPGERLDDRVQCIENKRILSRRAALLPTFMPTQGVPHRPLPVSVARVVNRSSR